ncbi:MULTISPECIES: hypothetical protein [unclassified Serratia (in: enterobacteria)]|uniref:hypothetical protein n=1 Tax=unclassified Serratia (in: enterobacteria) TaxID=2647522 RepID=UPI0030761104
MYYGDSSGFVIAILYFLILSFITFFVIRYAVMAKQIIMELKSINESQEKQLKIMSAILDDYLTRKSEQRRE